MKWIEALKEYNKDKNEWCIPKKGTDGYTKTKALMNSGTKELKGRKEQSNKQITITSS